jgi:hypothetical protein
MICPATTSSYSIGWVYLDCLQRGDPDPFLRPAQFFASRKRPPTADPYTRRILPAPLNARQKSVPSLLATQIAELASAEAELARAELSRVEAELARARPRRGRSRGRRGGRRRRRGCPWRGPGRTRRRSPADLGILRLRLLERLTFGL